MTTTLSVPHRSATRTPAPFRTAAILGSGVMGSQIAAHLANAGLVVELLDLPASDGPRNAVADKALAAARRMNPNPFFTPAVAQRVRVGNFEDHFERLATVDWIIEAVIENLEIKRGLMERIEAVARPDAVISTNTSGLPVAQIAAGRSESFRSRFVGTHFFNPPRYLKLFELIPTADTGSATVERLSWFARMHLGKGVVVAKDTPNFIANRIGTYAAMQAIREVTEHGYTIEEVDELTGTLVGRPRSATFRTADLVGLDTILHVSQNLYDAVRDDESREAFSPPWLLAKLVERGSLGAKTKEGFYKKEQGKILSVDPESMKYAPPKPKKLGDVDEIRKLRPLEERMRALYDDQGRAGELFRRTTLDLLSYTARRVPEIADDVADVDRAMELGFGWKLGPFALWDALGFERITDELTERGVSHLPSWIPQMRSQGVAAFHRKSATAVAGWSPAQGYVDKPVPPDVIDLDRLSQSNERLVWANDEARLLDIGDDVVLFEFRSKMNSIGRAVLDGLLESIDRLERNGDFAGMVIGNASEHFSVGANLFELGTAAVAGRWDEIEQAVATFQRATQRIRYASKPVVVATQGRVLGGACEMTMACPYPVCSAESYIGLVEIGAGLIPAGGGTMRMAAWAAESAVSDAPEHVAPFLRQGFETVAKARVATSAPEAQDLGFMSRAGTVVMNADRRLWVAKQQVLRLHRQGYAAPAPRTAIRVLGRAGRAVFDVGLQHMIQGGWVREHDAYVAGRIADVITGGDVPRATFLHEQELLDLEREAFVSLAGEKDTQQRIADLLTRNQSKTTQVVAKGLVSLKNVFRKSGKKRG